MTRLFENTATQVEGMLNALERWHPGASARLAANTFAEIESWDQLRIALVPEEKDVPSDARRGCSVAGGYLWQTNPPTLVVSQSMSRRRQRFTLLHELGHHIQSNDMDLGSALMECDDSEAFEDAACDAFAARILLPPELVRQSMPSSGPDVNSVLNLYQKSTASRAAICVQLASELRTPGVIAVFSAEGIVSFAAARGTTYPPAKGSDQSSNVLVAAAMVGSLDDHAITRDNARISYSTGHTSNQLYGQIAWCDGYLVAVMVEYGASWKSFSPPREGTAMVSTTSKWHDCETCGSNFVVKSRCASCGEPRCSNGHCACTRAAERCCPGCFVLKHPAQFSAGCEVCLDCAD